MLWETVVCQYSQIDVSIQITKHSSYINAGEHCIKITLR